MHDTLTEVPATTLVVTKEEYVAILVNVQDIALNLLSQRKKISQKVIYDQDEFVKKMLALLEDNVFDFSLEDVQKLLPQNSWYALYLETIPLLEMFVQNNPGGGIYHA